MHPRRLLPLRTWRSGPGDRLRCDCQELRRGRSRADDALGRLVSTEMRAHSARSDAFARPLAVLLARTGAIGAALDALEDSIGLGLAHYPYLARNSRAFAGMRDHPRFRRLLDVVRDRWERGGTSAADLAIRRA